MELKKLLQTYGIEQEHILMYGSNMAKINWQYAQHLQPQGKLVLVTAITPTPLGEGKTTISIGLVDGLNALGHKAIGALREPSLGPVFGRKGGATGGGKTTLQPDDQINLHFTGDFHAITSAHNLIASMIEQSLFFNTLPIDPTTICWRRAIDMNDRHLRDVTIRINDTLSYQSGFQITASSEIMAIFCLAQNFVDLKERLEQIIFAYDFDQQPLKVKSLQITDALLALLMQAFSPNVIQTSGGNLSFVHGGPFANIAHGTNSIIATKAALSFADYTITEAGFGADLGAEKFLHIVSPQLGKLPDVIVLVVTVKALKYHGKVAIEDVKDENMEALSIGIANLQKHITNLQERHIPLVVTINVFDHDTPKELEYIQAFVEQQGVVCTLNSAFLDGATGAKALANAVTQAKPAAAYSYSPLYTMNETIEVKIRRVVSMYGATDVVLSEAALADMVLLERSGSDRDLPICIAKTPESFTQKSKDRGIPQPYIAEIKRIKVAAGAGMVIVFMGQILDMPGLPKLPSAQKIQIDDAYKISGVD